MWYFRSKTWTFDPENLTFKPRSSPKERKKNSVGNTMTSWLLPQLPGIMKNWDIFIVSAQIIFLSFSLSGSSPLLSHLFFSFHLNYFSLSPLLPSSATSPILIARLARGRRQNRANLVLTAALTITSPPTEEHLTATKVSAEGWRSHLPEGGKTRTSDVEKLKTGKTRKGLTTMSH